MLNNQEQIKFRNYFKLVYKIKFTSLLTLNDDSYRA